jgi:hypothetical protein
MRTAKVSEAISEWELSASLEGSDAAFVRYELAVEGPWRDMGLAEKDYFAAYVECRNNGCNEKLADMLASQQGPGLLTDATFMEGKWDGGITDLKTRLRYKGIAEKAGVNAEGRQYVSGLANYPGDPAAWVDGTSEIKAKCEQRGWNCTGAVEVTSKEPKAPPKRRGNVADRLRAAGLPVGQ